MVQSAAVAYADNKKGPRLFKFDDAKFLLVESCGHQYTFCKTCSATIERQQSGHTLANCLLILKSEVQADLMHAVVYKV